MNKKFPKISIVTPSYNQGQFLEETIQSVLSQNYPNLEYIIIDGGSTDNSVEIIKKYEKDITYWVSEKDNGQSDAINKGFSKATGEIFAWLNSDDVYCPGTLDKVSRYWARNPDCHFLAGDGTIFDTTTKKIEHYVTVWAFSYCDLFKCLRGDYLPQPSVFFSREAFSRAGGIDINLHLALDLDLWFRIRAIYPLHYLPTYMSKLRHHDNAKTWKYNEEMVEEVLNVFKKYLDKIGFFKRWRITQEIRHAHAIVLCCHSLIQYFNSCYFKSRKLLRKAFFKNPTVIFSRQWLGPALRLTLPEWIKKRIFAKP